MIVASNYDSLLVANRYHLAFIDRFARWPYAAQMANLRDDSLEPIGSYFSSVMQEMTPILHIIMQGEQQQLTM